MSMTSSEHQAHDASVGLVLYECETLRTQLGLITPPKYTEQLKRLADVYLVYVDALQWQLQRIHDDIQASDAGGGTYRLEVRTLARMTRSLFEATRLLDSGADSIAPICIQREVERLLERHWPAVQASCAVSQVIAVVRGRWKYNFTHMPLLAFLEDALVGREGNSTRKTEPLCFGEYIPDGQVLPFLWKKFRSPESAPPAYATALSFPRADADDVLLSPLLIHELGHLIDEALVRPLHARVAPEHWFSARRVTGIQLGAGEDSDDERDTLTRVRRGAEQTRAAARQDGSAGAPPTVFNVDSFRADLRTHFRREVDRDPEDDEVSHAANVFSDMATEIAVDLLAVRMIGIPYVVALAEYLKPQAFERDRPLLAYPGIEHGRSYPSKDLRLRILVDELLADSEGGLAILPALDALAERDKTNALRNLRAYLIELRNAGVMHPTVPEMDDAMRAIERFVELTILAGLPNLIAEVRTLVPVERAATFGESILPLLEELSARAALSISADAGISYSEILMAGWCYQLSIGDGIEDKLPGRFNSDRSLRTSNEAATHYSQTCALLWTAVKKLSQ